MGRTCGTHGLDEKCKVLVGKLGGMTRLGTSKRLWEDNIRIDLKGTGFEAVDYRSIQLT
jgi:hypothetical protein